MRLRIRENLLWLSLRLLKALDRRDTSSRTFRPEAVHALLLISSTALGDTVLSTAAIHRLRQRYPAARIVVLANQPFVQLLENHPDIDVVVPYHGGYRRFLRTVAKLRAYRPDTALILHGNEPQATPLAYLSGARHIFKLPNANRFRFLLANQDVMTWANFSHGLQQRLAVAALAGAGAEVAGARMSLPISAAAKTEVDAWLQSQGIGTDACLIGFQLGASSRSRMWPAQRFVALARALLQDNPTLRFVLTGSPQEIALCAQVAAAIGAAARVSAGALSIASLPALIQRLTLLVSGDTGTMHVAVAVETPTVCLFSVSRPAVSGPAYDLDRHRVIHRPYAAAVSTKTQDPCGMMQIAVDDVQLEVESVLRQRAEMQP